MKPGDVVKLKDDCRLHIQKHGYLYIILSLNPINPYHNNACYTCKSIASEWIGDIHPGNLIAQDSAT